jgi:hypothetical protein
VSDLLLPLTLLATIITIITGTITIFGFVQQYRKSRTKTSPKADPLIQPAPYQSTGVGEPPSVLHPATSWPSQPLPNPPAPTPSAPLVHGPMMPSTTASHKPFRLQQAWWRFSPSYPKLTIFALLGQVIWVLFLVLISLRSPNGSTYLYEVDLATSAGTIITFVVGATAISGCALYALIAAGRLQSWGWLIGVLLGTIVGSILVAGIAPLVFGLWGPTTHRGQQVNSYPQAYFPVQSTSYPAPDIDASSQVPNVVATWPSQPTPYPYTNATTGQLRLQQAWWRFSPSYPKLTIFALLGQVIWVLFLVLIFIPGPDGSTSLWKTDAVIDVTSTIALLASLITLIGSAVYATIAAARLHRWGWLTGVLLGSFVGSILVPGVPSLVFSLWGPTTRPGQQAYRYLQPSWPDPSKPM